MENLSVDSNIQGRESFFILAEKRRVLEQQVAQAVLVPVLRTKMTGRVPIQVLRVDVRTLHQHRLNHSQVAADRSYVQRGAKVA